MSLIEPETDKKIGKVYELFYTDCKLPVKSGKRKKTKQQHKFCRSLSKVYELRKTKQTAKVLKITLSVCTIFFCGVY